MSGLTSIFDLCVNLGWPPCPAQIARPVGTYWGHWGFVPLTFARRIKPIGDSGDLLPLTFRYNKTGRGRGDRLAPLNLEIFRRAWRTKKRTIWIVYFRLKEKMNSAKAAGNSSMDFCLFLTQYATDDGRRQLCTVLALMNFPYYGFFFVNFLAAMGWISPGGRSK